MKKRGTFIFAVEIYSCNYIEFAFLTVKLVKILIFTKKWQNPVEILSNNLYNSIFMLVTVTFSFVKIFGQVRF